MSSSALDNWWPVTFDHGLIRANLDKVVSAREKIFSASGVKVTSTRCYGPLSDCLAGLEPLSPAPTKELFLATAFGWTAYFANGCRGSDPFLSMYQLSGALQTRALRVCAAPDNAEYPSIILEVYDMDEAGSENHGNRRSIAAANDGGRWVFEHSGTPFSFEDTARYASHRIGDRFTKEMLWAYVTDLGAQPLSDDRLQINGMSQGIMLGRGTHRHLPQYSLEEAKGL